MTYRRNRKGFRLSLVALNEEECTAYTIAELDYSNSPRILVIDEKSRDHTAHVA